jgi:Predicted Zn-dependent protease (DUF2268)
MNRLSIHLRGNRDRSLARTLRDSFEEADAFVQPLLPTKDVTTKVQSDFWEKDGLSARAKTSDRVLIDVNPSHEGIHDIVRDHMRYVVAHEYHHCARMQGPGCFGRTLGAALVSEGLAVQFEREIGRNEGTNAYSWHADAVSGEEFLDGVRALHHRLGDRVEGKEIYPGLPYHQKIPAFGYRFALGIVNTYQRANGNPTAAQLVHTPADEILKATFG